MNPQRAIPSLDGMRAIAILLVVVSHISVGLYYQYAASMTRMESIAQMLFLVGHLGVTVFFVISGFLITTLLLKDDVIDLKKFYFRRTMRIFPPFYFYLLVMLGAALAGLIKVSPYNFLTSATYTRNYFFDDSAPGAWYLAHTWSLSVEEQFYLLFPVLLVLLGRRWGLKAVAVALILCPLFRLVYMLSYPGASMEFGRFETVADSLAIGCVLAAARGWLHEREWYSTLIQSNFVLVTPMIALLVTSVGHFPNYYSKPLYVVMAIPLQNLSIALFLDWSVTNYEGRIGRLLNARPLAYIGLISYSIYLWQQPFLNPALDLPIVLKLVLTFSAALFSYYVVEKPFLRLRHRMEQKRVHPSAQLAEG